MEIVVFQTMLMVQNEYHVFNWTAHVSMFGMGMVDNTLQSYLTQLMGFEFKSKITPFALKNFMENMTVFIVFIAISIFGMEAKRDFRIFLIVAMVLGVLSVMIQFTLKLSKWKRNLQI